MYVKDAKEEATAEIRNKEPMKPNKSNERQVHNANGRRRVSMDCLNGF
jgi:hypothetical protein